MKTYTYEIVNSHFHGGDHIQFCKSIASGVRSCHRLQPHGCQSGYCKCGGYQVARVDGKKFTDSETEELYSAKYKLSQK